MCYVSSLRNALWAACVVTWGTESETTKNVTCDPYNLTFKVITLYSYMHFVENTHGYFSCVQNVRLLEILKYGIYQNWILSLMKEISRGDTFLIGLEWA